MSNVLVHKGLLCCQESYKDVASPLTSKYTTLKLCTQRNLSEVETLLYSFLVTIFLFPAAPTLEGGKETEQVKLPENIC